MHITLVHAQGQDQDRTLRPVVRFASSSLADLVQLVNDTKSPTTFDLGDQELHSVGSGDIIISASDVSIKNATISLETAGAASPNLCFSGTGVQMDDIIISGGNIGVRLLQGASVTMRACTLHRNNIGVHAVSAPKPDSAQPSLVVHGLKILNCTTQSIYCGANKRMQLTDCLVTGNSGAHSIVVHGSLQATRLSCTGCAGKGLHVGARGDAVVTDSIITGSTGCSVDAQAGSKLTLGRCTIDGTTATTKKECITTSHLQQVGDVESANLHGAGWLEYCVLTL